MAFVKSPAWGVRFITDFNTETDYLPTHNKMRHTDDFGHLQAAGWMQDAGC